MKLLSRDKLQTKNADFSSPLSIMKSVDETTVTGAIRKLTSPVAIED